MIHLRSLTLFAHCLQLLLLCLKGKARGTRVPNRFLLFEKFRLTRLSGFRLARGQTDLLANRIHMEMHGHLHNFLLSLIIRLRKW